MKWQQRFELLREELRQQWEILSDTKGELDNFLFQTMFFRE